MTPWWWPPALLIAGVIAQIGIGIFSGRLKRVEDAIEKINKRKSEEDDKVQRWYWNVQTRLTVIETKSKIDAHGEEDLWQRS